MAYSLHGEEDIQEALDLQNRGAHETDAVYLG